MLFYYPCARSRANGRDAIDQGKLKVAGIVNKTFKLEEWQACLDAMKDKTAVNKLSKCEHRGFVNFHR